MYVYTCEPVFDAMMTCIYRAWEHATRVGHDQIRLQTEPVEQMSLFEQYVHVDTDTDQAERVVRSIRQKISDTAYVYVYDVAMSKERDALDVIYRFLIRGFAFGSQILNHLMDPCVARFWELKRAVGNEEHYFREFARFVMAGPVYVCHLEPKNDVILLVAAHFADRMPSEHWMIIDDNRKKAVVHPRDASLYVRELSGQELEQLLAAENLRDEYSDLWKDFFDAIAIKQRYNPKCQRNLMPIWMRRHVTEFR